MNVRKESAAFDLLLAIAKSPVYHDEIFDNEAIKDFCEADYVGLKCGFYYITGKGIELLNILRLIDFSGC